ncbi:hypothetical protein T01_15471 [Trichinella spiralis]|uniref:Uncharacterized protein n=1 Tax=Trichinella spiralis TaxID=6334 RepID=A0A0V1BWQ3_TRISP|nr:hypothetical protein T01_15471 [Trichinella spiralis]
MPTAELTSTTETMVIKKNKSTQLELSTVGSMAERSSTAAITACEPNTRRPMPDFDGKNTFNKLNNKLGT